MKENKLYYYTTIDKLALILNSKAIRFTRLDLFDDMREIEPFVEYNPLKYIFASCHTKDSQENIPLWKMYSSMERGVRIEFDKTTIFAPRLVNIVVPKTELPFDIPPLYMSVLSSEQIINSDYNALPMGNMKDFGLICQHLVYKDVIYDDNYADIYRGNLTINDTPNGKNTVSRKVNFCPSDFGYYKTTYWQFQNESRFLIYTNPFLENYNILYDTLAGNKSLNTEYIDVGLYYKCFDNMAIRLSPKADESARLIVKALTKDFPNIRIEDSILKDSIR